MAERDKRTIISQPGGFFSGISDYLKLVIRLMGDRRISPFLKLIPFGTLVYLFMPDLIPLPFDDAAIIGLGVYLFVELCPPEIVEEHRAALMRTIPGHWQDPQQTGENEIVDAEFRDED